jgi:hypothetical protein
VSEGAREGKGQYICWKSGGHYEKGKVAAAKTPSLCMVAESKIPRTIKERQVGQCVCLPLEQQPHQYIHHSLHMTKLVVYYDVVVVPLVPKLLSLLSAITHCWLEGGKHIY